ncbi:hypothetical protein DPSP01_002881 [Paraphaeosphaeria sporulosa]
MLIFPWFRTSKIRPVQDEQTASRLPHLHTSNDDNIAHAISTSSGPKMPRPVLNLVRRRVAISNIPKRKHYSFPRHPINRFRQNRMSLSWLVSRTQHLRRICAHLRS